jgi:hypothetical protein
MTGIEDKSPRPMAAVLESMFMVWVCVVRECVKACRLAEITGVTGQVIMGWTDEVDGAFIGSDAADIGDCLRARLDSMVSPQSGTLIG